MRKSLSKTQIFVLAMSLAFYPAIACALGPANTVHTGPVISGGTYFNTPDGQTTFKNTSGGLWLKSGSNLKGVEVNNVGNLTNNGGTFHFYVPGQVIRLDGNVDVRGIQNGSGAFLGNGGKVFLDSAYVYQSGKIYANGLNGGLVQFNVGAASLIGNARIEAKGTGQGTGGIIAINASGPVDLRRQVVLDTSGRVAGTFDTNVINIEGGLVNVEGTLRANGLVGEADGISPGGLIRLVSTGQSDLTQAQQALQNGISGNSFTASEAAAVNTRLTALKTSNDGDVSIASATSIAGQAILEARGGFGLASGNDPTDHNSRAGDGGTIIITAQRDIQNGGFMNASGGQGNPYPLSTNLNHVSNGGNGGTISLNANRNINNTGRIVNNGGDAGLSINMQQGLNGGTGGLTVFSYGSQMQNTGVVLANGGSGAYDFGMNGNGGNGGLVVLSGSANAGGTGYIVTQGGASGTPAGSINSTGSAGKLGSIVTPNPVTATNFLIGNWRTTEPLELLTHNENLILLGNQLPNNGTISPSELRDDFSAWLRSARIRSVTDARGEIGDERGPALDEFYSKIDPNGFPYRNFIFANSLTGLTVPFDPSKIMRNQSVQRTFAPFYNTMTALTTGNMTLGQFWPTPDQPFQFGNGGLVGGRFSAISNNFPQGYQLYLNGGITGGGINIAAAGQLQTGSFLAPGFTKNFSADGNFHGGSMIFKAGQDLGSLETGRAVLTANGGVSGGTVQLISQNQLSNFGSMQVNGNLIGGSALLQAGTTLSNYTDRNALISANGGSYGGFVKLKAPVFQTIPPDFIPIQLQATGSIQNGQVITEH